MIDYQKLENSLRLLQLQYANYNSADQRPELSELDKEAIKESVIQRFETCYEILWKTLKRYLTEALGLTDTPNSPKPIFRLAFENKLLPSDISQWINYANARIATSHDYSGQKAAETLQITQDFISDAIALYETLTGKTWK